jgi:hypothetical protein
VRFPSFPGPPSYFTDPIWLVTLRAPTSLVSFNGNSLFTRSWPCL